MSREGLTPSPLFVITIEANPDGLMPGALARFLSAAQGAVGLKGSVTVLIAGNERLRELNRRFRRKDKPTDVLSFPAAPQVQTQVQASGDIAISADIAAQNATMLGHSLCDEIKVLMLHGVLHLAGYDHETDVGEMAALEQRLRRKLKLPVSLTERRGNSQPRRRKR